MDHNLDKDFISEILSSLKIRTLNKGVNSSVRPINFSSNTNSTNINNNSDSQNSSTEQDSEAFVKFCKNSKLADLDEEIAILCLNKMHNE